MEKAPNNLLHGKRVLVVEDDALAAFDIMKTLREAGAEILVPAMSLARALEFATEDFDCAVLDVVLRDPQGVPKDTAKTDKDGKFVFKNVAPGTYQIVVRKTSSNTQGQAVVQVAAGDEKELAEPIKLVR